MGSTLTDLVGLTGKASGGSFSDSDDDGDSVESFSDSGSESDEEAAELPDLDTHTWLSCEEPPPLPSKSKTVNDLSITSNSEDVASINSALHSYHSILAPTASLSPSKVLPHLTSHVLNSNALEKCQFTRVKVLVLLPTRGMCLKLMEKWRSIVDFDDCERLEEEYGVPEDTITEEVRFASTEFQVPHHNTN